MNSEDFENPPEDDETMPDEFASEGNGSFDDPPENGGEEQVEDEEFAAEEAEQFSDVGDDLIQAFDEIESQLLLQGVDEDGATYSAEDVEGAGNIVGVGYGQSDVMSMDLDPGAIALNVYVAEPVSVDEVKSVIVDSMGVSAVSSDDFALNVVHTGPFDADSHRFKIRPAPGGVSVGHFRITAGTLGCLARGRRAPRNRRVLILSNNHVLANSNNARRGDSIIQPGRADGGVSPRDRIAILENWRPIAFGCRRVNYVDCATGWAWHRLVRRELVYRSRRRLRFFRINSRIRACRRGMLVGKTGRTTQLRRGRIVDCNATVKVNYGGGRCALFRDQIIIGTRGFSAGGDSGSIVWTWDPRRNPVGLLFAGSRTHTIANKMWRVLRALDINLYT